MTPLSRVWGKWLLVGQYANFVLVLLMAFGSGASDVAWLQTWKAHALELHGTISALLASLQALARALPDTDGNGVPDILEAPASPAAER